MQYKYVFQRKLETKLWQLLPASQIEEEKKTSDKKTTKLNISSEARGKMMAAVTNKATSSHDCILWIFIGIYAVVNSPICIMVDWYKGTRWSLVIMFQTLLLKHGRVSIQ